MKEENIKKRFKKMSLQLKKQKNYVSLQSKKKEKENGILSKRLRILKKMKI